MKIQAEMNTEWKITQLGNSVRGLPVEWIRYKTNISDLKIPHQSMKKQIQNMRELWNNMKITNLLIIGMEDQSSLANDVDQILHSKKKMSQNKRKKQPYKWVQEIQNTRKGLERNSLCYITVNKNH